VTRQDPSLRNMSEINSANFSTKREGRMFPELKSPSKCKQNSHNFNK